MNQKNRIEPTFGNVDHSRVEADNQSSTLERINKSSEVLTNLAPRESKSEVEMKAETKPAISPFVSMKTNNAPAHTFSPPLDRVVVSAQPQQSPAQSVAQSSVQNVQPSMGSNVQANMPPHHQATLSAQPQQVAQPTMQSQGTAQPQATVYTQPVVEPTRGTIPENSVAQKVEPTEKPAVKPNMERVIPTAMGAGSTSENKKENMPKVPSKFRRLLAVILLALLGGVAFWLLKPNTPQTVAELENQSQSNSLPIEFRPVNEDEAKAAEAREAEALAQQQAQQTAEQQAQTPAGNNGENVAMTEQTAEQANPQAGAETAPVSDGVSFTQDSVTENKTVETSTTSTATTETAKADSTTSPAVAPVKQSTTPAVKVVKPNSQGSVIYQPERGSKVKPAEKTVEKKAEQPKVKAMTAAEYKAKVEKNARLDQLIQNVESGKPAVTKATSATTTKVVASAAPTQSVQKVVATAAPAQPVQKVIATAAPTQKVVATAAPAQSNVVVASKAMTVPKSTSLMQVFRDNGLNISDVNAMSRANGIVSNLKVNEKVTVRLDKNNRVVEMSIGSGGRFTRQADGSYRFQ